MTVILGVDPGLSGAVAFLDTDTGALVGCWDMPHADGLVLAPRLAAIVGQFEVAAAWVERAQSMPGQGVSSTHRYGAAWGTVLGVVGALRIPLHHISPAVWKRAAGLSKDKGASRRRAVELWPEHAEAFARVKDDGRAEAALIARHGWLTTRGNP